MNVNLLTDPTGKQLGYLFIDLQWIEDRFAN